MNGIHQNLTQSDCWQLVSEHRSGVGPRTVEGVGEGEGASPGPGNMRPRPDVPGWESPDGWGPVSPNLGHDFCLREVDRLERNALDWKDRLKLSSGGRRTEDHLRPQQQRSRDGLGAQDIQCRMASLHVDHHRDPDPAL